MSIFSMLKKLLGIGNKGSVSVNKNPSNEDDLGTMIRTELRYQMSPLSPELTAAQMAEQQAWFTKHIKKQKRFYKGEIILGTYEIEDIKAGGMGYVYIANHKDWNIKVAIKSPNEKMLSSKSLFSRVLKEANSWIELGLHPHIAYCYYVRQIDEIPHIFIEYVDGGNLKDWIINKRCQDLKIGIDLAIQFCHGMEYAHSHGMIHRDVKPQNILMTSDGILKITDFGIARTHNSEKDLQEFDIHNKEDLFGDEEPTSAGAIMGSIEYMSPEQWLNPHDVDPRADIYSYGLCLYEMLCGKMPYNSSVRDRKPEEEPYNPHKLRRGIPNQLGDLLLKCVAWKREDRYSSFGELRKELLDIYRNCFNEEAPHAKVIDAGLRAQGLNNRAVSYIELNRKEEAIELWEEALIEEPQHLEATYNRDIILWREGKLADDELIKHLEAVKNDNTDDMMAEYLLALVHLERGDKASALKILEKLLIQDKNKPEIKIAYGMAQSSNLMDIKYKDTFLGHESEIHSISLSQDDRYAVTGSGIYGRDSLIRLWDMETCECLKIFEGHTGAVSTVCFSKDSSLIVSGSYDNSVQIWNVKTGKNLGKLEGHNNYVNSVCISSDNRYVLSGSNDVTIRLWDLNKNECLRVFDGHAGYVNSICISHDNRYALSGSNDRTLRLWDLNTGQCIRIFHGHKSFVRSVHLSKDSKFAVSGSDDNTIKLWDVNTGECLRTLLGHKGFVRSVFISNDNLYAISGGDDKSIRIWDLVKGKCLRTIDEHEGYVRCVCLSSDNSFALSGGDDRRLISWELSLVKPFTFPLRLSRSWSHAELVKIDKQAEDLYHQANKALENNRFNSALSAARQLRNLPGHKRESKSVELWNKLSSVCIRTELRGAWHVRTFRGHRDRVTSLSMDSDNRFVLSGSNDETVRVWDIKTGDCLRTLEGHTMGVRSVSITPDGRYALSGGGDETIRFWDVKTGECIRVFGENKGSVSAVHLSLNGKLALTAGISSNREKREDDNYLRLWSTAKGECIRTLVGHTNWVNSCYLSSDERYALSGGYDNTVKLWELNTGRCLRTFKGHTGIIYSVCLSSNGRYAISGSGDGTIRLWSIDNGECLRVLKGHRELVSSVTLSKDNRYAISGSRDNTIRIWDAKNGQCLRILEGHTDWVNSVAVSNDCRYIVSGSEDESIRLWELDWELEAP